MSFLHNHTATQLTDNEDERQKGSSLQQFGKSGGSDLRSNICDDSFCISQSQWLAMANNTNARFIFYHKKTGTIRVLPIEEYGIESSAEIVLAHIKELLAL